MRDAVSRRVNATPLRTRLTAITVVLAGIGLLVAGVATYFALQSFLVDRLDQQLHTAAADQGLQGALLGRTPITADQLPPEGYALLITSSGSSAIHFGERVTATPPFLATAPIGYSSVGGFRILNLAVGDGPGSTVRVVVAIPLSDVQGTLNRLVLLELLVGVIVLGVIGAVALVVVRAGMRPLERIEETAGAIAAGDLTQRVEDADPRTEVGRLGSSLNVMLHQIERAFTERAESQDRLRRFVADASHELRTPLTSVRGYAELFRRGASERPDDLAVVMRRIEAEAERMGVLVEDLLLLAQLDQSRPLEAEPVDLTAVVSELVADHRMLRPEWPIDLDAVPVTLVGDEQRLRQAVRNLLSNACAHTPAGTHVSVRVQARDDSAIVEVADDGPGLAPEEAERVFERFFRSDPSRTRARGGTGLGLSIVSAIAEAHAGRAELDSTPGHGSTFRLVLPTAR
jgi:two-component system, OmpR family, sensor kinase